MLDRNHWSCPFSFMTSHMVLCNKPSGITRSIMYKMFAYIVSDISFVRFLEMPFSICGYFPCEKLFSLFWKLLTHASTAIYDFYISIRVNSLFSILASKASLIWTELTERNVLTWPELISEAERGRKPQKGKISSIKSGAFLLEKIFSTCF